MTNPTRQQIITAYEALETLCARAGEHTPVNHMRTLILSALPPKPRPTMADVEWEDDKHFLAEAEHHLWGKVIMIFQSVDTQNIFVDFQDDGGRQHIYCPPGSLTPTGRRYTLTEVQDD